MSDISDLIIVAPKGGTTALSKRWSSDEIMAFAESLIGLKELEQDPTGAVKEIASVASLIASGSSKIARAVVKKISSSDSQFEKFELYSAFHENRRLVEFLMRRILEREELLAKALPQIDVLEVGSTQINSIRFPAGVPQRWSAYKAHPFDRQFFVPLAHFHDFMLNDKKAEFVRITSALGAKRIEMLEGESDSRSGNVGGGGRKMGVGGEAEVGASAASSESFSLGFKNSSKPSEPPRLLDDTRWLSGEPLWQAMVETRLNQWATEFRVKFQYTSDFGVNAEVAAGLQAYSFSIGGEYQEKQTVDHEYLVEFWPRNAYEDMGE